MRLVDDCHSAVVAGAGIGGATAALVLARAGVEVTLCERVANPTAVGAGIVLQPNGLAVLYALGLADALQASASRITRAVVRAGGRALLEEPIPDFGGGLDHALALPRSALSAILLGAVRASPRIDLRLGSHVRQVRIAGDGVVVESGAGLMELRADLVIGADGVRSAVRAFVAPGARDRFAGYSYVRALVAGEWRGFTGEWWTSLGLFGGSGGVGAGSASFTAGRETLVGLRFLGSTATSSEAPQSFAPRFRR